MRVNKFVLDANIWVSYFITNTEQLLADIVVEYKVTFYYCSELITEIQRVLNYPHLEKHHINIGKAISFLKDISVDFPLMPVIKKYIPGDENDNYIIAPALQTNSGFITSGN